MRFLHTADWHLGRVYHGLSLLEEQSHLLDQFVDLVHKTKPDVVLIAGDIYDRSVPPAEAVGLLDKTLNRIVIGAKTPVILIAGNHDGAERLGFGSQLLGATGLTVRGLPESNVEPVILSDEYGEVAIYPLPYADPAQVRQLFANEEITDHHAGLGAQMDRLRAVHQPGRRAVVVAHAFVNGGSVCESERSLSVGGSSSVGADVFAGMNYVALGHLHRPQSMGSTQIHYSGSLMKYSFNEADQPKSISLVELDGEGRVSIERITLTPRRDLRILQGSLQQLIDAAASDPGREDYVMARLTDLGALLDPMSKLRTVYPNALAIERVQHQGNADGLESGQDHRKVGIDELFSGFYQDMTGRPLEDEALKLLLSEISVIDQGQREVVA
jgi:exonuclease SbcD